MSSRTIKAIEGTLTSFLQYGVQIILQIALAPIVLKVAGQETLGAYAIIMQIVGLGILLDLGFGVALGRYLSQAFGIDDDGASFREVFTLGKYFLLVSNLIFSLLIFILAINIGDFISANHLILAQAREALYCLAVWTIIRTPFLIYQQALIATQNMASVNVIAIVGNASRLVLSLVFVYSGLGLTGLILANIFSELFVLALNIKIFNKLLSHYKSNWKVFNVKRFKDMIGFGLSYSGVNVAVVMFLGCDLIVVGNLYGAAVGSVYYTTKIPAFLAFQLIFKLSDNAAPAVNELIAKGSYEALKNAYIILFRYSILIALPVSVGIIGLNEFVISTWVGSQQFAGNIMTFALASFVISQTMNHINAMIIVATGNMGGWSTLSIVSAALTLILSYWLGRDLGLQYIMVVIAVMDFPILIFLFYRSIKNINVTIQDLWSEVFRPCILSAAPLILLIAFFKWLNPISSWLNLILIVIALAIVWIISTYKFGLKSNEQKILKSKCLSYLS
jgi:O-antigen/teichoic acid export membrane protein